MLDDDLHLNCNETKLVHKMLCYGYKCINMYFLYAYHFKTHMWSFNGICMGREHGRFVYTVFFYGESFCVLERAGRPQARYCYKMASLFNSLGKSK